MTAYTITPLTARLLELRERDGHPTVDSNATGEKVRHTLFYPDEVAIGDMAEVGADVTALMLHERPGRGAYTSMFVGEIGRVSADRKWLDLQSRYSAEHG